MPPNKNSPGNKGRTASTTTAAAAPAGEETPLLQSSNSDRDDSSHAAFLGQASEASRGSASRVSFRRTSITRAVSTRNKGSRRPSTGADNRTSLRGVDNLFPSEEFKQQQRGAGHFEPIDALAPLVAGGVIVATDGYMTDPHPPSSAKSLPAFVPFRRRARHRSFALWWINQFRHWWKSSRLLVRLAGLWTLAVTGIFMAKMIRVSPGPFKHHKQKLTEKNAFRAVRIVKKLGRGGPMKYFLNFVHPFTRTLRILVAAWRWIEAAQCRRGEVGTEEAMAFIGNRVSRMLARTFVDLFVLFLVMPAISFIFQHKWLPPDAWHPITVFVLLGVLRACAPYAASFQGSRAGRVLTRAFFRSSKHRWRPIQHVDELNLLSDDCCENDEVSQTADLARLAKLVATALGKGQQIGVDGVAGAREALQSEGFHQIGAGSGGYAVYECRRRVFSRETTAEGELMTILLHITPYGPSILDVMPRYVVLEFEDSVDRRNNWSEFVSKQIVEGPPVVEGYCYNGAFFSPHHFAEMKAMYDKQLLAYNRACQVMCKPRTGRSPNPPSNLLSLKAFLAEGKPPKKRRKNAREGRQLRGGVSKVARELKAMMSLSKGPDACCAPRGVILYFEGLDCAGKSSTGGLVEQALQQAGYHVEMRQYNRPPTAEQKLQPWMDRFEVPQTSSVTLAVGNGSGEEDAATTMNQLQKCLDHNHSALTWDRGPAGDFVYNPEFRAMGQEERRNKYREFMMFDHWCFENRILFLKLLFVTNRDSIASTLGKRLAQKKMARDLHTWLKSSRGGESDYGDIGFEGLDEIELHIDPTDFIAFNNYQTNLRIFTNFALNTDNQHNPWVVVNTTDRYSARKQLLRAFRVKLERFKAQHACCPWQLQASQVAHEDTPGLSEHEMLEKGFRKPLPIQLLVSLIGLLFLVFFYSEHTTFGHPFKDTYIPGAAYFDKKGNFMMPMEDNSKAVMLQVP